METKKKEKKKENTLEYRHDFLLEKCETFLSLFVFFSHGFCFFFFFSWLFLASSGALRRLQLLWSTFYRFRAEFSKEIQDGCGGDAAARAEQRPGAAGAVARRRGHDQLHRGVRPENPRQIPRPHPSGPLQSTGIQVQRGAAMAPHGGIFFFEKKRKKRIFFLFFEPNRKRRQIFSFGWALWPCPRLVLCAF